MKTLSAPTIMQRSTVLKMLSFKSHRLALLASLWFVRRSFQ